MNLRFVEKIAISVISLMCLIVVQGGQSNAMDSAGWSLESAHAGKETYPDGSRLYSEYETFKGVKLQIAEVGVVNAQTVALGAASLVQSALPEKVSLTEGIAHMAAKKWWINYGLKYEGIPVAKGGDALAIVRKDGQLLSIRKRKIYPKQ